MYNNFITFIPNISLSTRFINCIFNKYINLITSLLIKFFDPFNKLILNFISIELYIKDNIYFF